MHFSTIIFSEARQRRCVMMMLAKYYRVETLFIVVVYFLFVQRSFQKNSPRNCFTHPSTMQCINGGSCIRKSAKTPNQYSCRCPRLFCGKFCQAENPCYIGDRFRTPCLHRANCRCFGTVNVWYRCSCRGPFTGKNCETIPDQYNPCVQKTICPDGSTCVPDLLRLHRKSGGKYVVAYKCLDKKGKSLVGVQVADVNSTQMALTKAKGTKRTHDSAGTICNFTEKVRRTNCEELHRSSVQETPIQPNTNSPGDIGGSCAAHTAYNQLQNSFKDNYDIDSIKSPGDTFSDIDTSDIDTSQIDDLIFSHDQGNSIQSRSLARKYGNRRRNLQARSTIMKSERPKSISPKPTFAKRNVDKGTRALLGTNPCRHGSTCIPLKSNGYKCVCVEGTSGHNCSTGCPLGRFKPPKCEHLCGQCKGIGRICDYETGACKESCLPGWRGRTCKIRDGWAVVMKTKLDGPYNKVLKDITSLEHMQLKTALTNWIVPICIKDLNSSCSIYDVKMSAGSVNIDYEVLFDSSASWDNIEKSSNLAKTLKRNTATFNSTLYKVVAQSIVITDVKTFMSFKQDGKAMAHMYVSIGSIVALGLAVCLLCVMLWLYKRQLNRTNGKLYYTQS